MAAHSMNRESGVEIINDYRFIRTGDDRCVMVFAWDDDGKPETFLSMNDQAWIAALRRIEQLLVRSTETATVTAP